MVPLLRSSINSEYLLHLYEIFQKYVSSPPTVTSIVDKNSGKIRYNLSFATLALPCFNELYEKFYVDGKKLVPNDISDLLSEVSLAYWIMDDGTFTGSGLKLSTDAFSDRDLDLLIKALDKKLGIKAKKHIQNKAKGQYTLYISKDQLPLVKSLVMDYIHPTMIYKLGLK